MSNPTQAASYGGPNTAGYATSYPATYPVPSYPENPTWAQLFYFQSTIMQLQSEIIRLQTELDKIKNTKEWLVGPENSGADVQK